MRENGHPVAFSTGAYCGSKGVSLTAAALARRAFISFIHLAE